ncbi:hypothetical protein DXG01_013361 [Tephrocybe rancida]|nr:hypothetical protein DXG01_013361 [Tephrocybe rancida]
MEPASASILSMYDLSPYRDFTFPRTTGKASSSNFVLIDARDWANPDASKKLDLEDLNASNVLWEDEEPCAVAEYRDWLFPEGLRAHHQFDLENIKLWFLDAPFKLFPSQKQPKPLAQSSALGKRKIVPEIIEISDDDDDKTPPPPAILRRSWHSRHPTYDEARARTRESGSFPS